MRYLVAVCSSNSSVSRSYVVVVVAVAAAAAVIVVVMMVIEEEVVMAEAAEAIVEAVLEDVSSNRGRDGSSIGGDRSSGEVVVMW